MADIIDSGPVFVDVASGAQYPITELLSLATPHNESMDCDYDQTKQEVKDYGSVQDVRSLQATTQTNFKTSTKPKKYQCTLCVYATNHKAVFDEHVRVHNGIKPFKCSYCPYRSASKKNAKIHELKHRPDNPLRCKQCDFFGRNQWNLSRHMQSHHVKQEVKAKIKDPSEMKCPKCDFTYKNLTELKKHRRYRRRCNQCKFVGCTSGVLHKHRKYEHGLPLKKKSYLFTCSICQWQGDFLMKILLHLIHHPNQQVDEGTIDISLLKEHGIMK